MKCAYCQEPALFEVSTPTYEWLPVCGSPLCQQSLAYGPEGAVSLDDE
jgi:hypothetical protein